MDSQKTTDKDVEHERYQENPFALSVAVYFETSNYCNLAYCHERCPAHKALGEPAHLPMKIIREALSSLSKYDYRGEIRWHMMSDPLSDPRLFLLLHDARAACPHSPLVIWTNASYLDQVLADELAEAGVTELKTTAYSKSERARHKRLRFAGHHEWYGPRSLEKRLLLQYDAEPVGSTAACLAPLQRLSIAHDGKVILCCRDWRHAHAFGDLHEQSLDEIVRRDEVWETYRRLRAGDRFLPLCQRCYKRR